MSATAEARQRVRVSHGLAVVAAVAVLSVARTGYLALAVALAGTLAVVAGMAVGRRGLVHLGGVALFGAAALVATAGAPVIAVLVAAFGAVLAADSATFALGIERDVDTSVATTRVELLHAVGSTAVAVLTAGLGYALYVSAPAGSGLGVVALLGGAVVLVVALRV
jgi:hypothetical protein